jgi:hypothetical protein
MQGQTPNQRTLTEQLLHVEDRLDLCRKLVDQQQEIIEEQLARGEDPSKARRLLGEMNNLLSLNIVERDRLKKELDDLLR